MVKFPSCLLLLIYPHQGEIKPVVYLLFYSYRKTTKFYFFIQNATLWTGLFQLLCIFTLEIAVLVVDTL